MLTMRPVRVLPHITKLHDCFGDFLVRVTCPCGLSRHIKHEALARPAGRRAAVEGAPRSTSVTAQPRPRYSQAAPGLLPQPRTSDGSRTQRVRSWLKRPQHRPSARESPWMAHAPS